MAGPAAEPLARPILATPDGRAGARPPEGRRTGLLIQAAGWLSAVGVALSASDSVDWPAVAALGLASVALSAWWSRRSARLARRAWAEDLAGRLAGLLAGRPLRPGPGPEPEPDHLRRELERVERALRTIPARDPAPSVAARPSPRGLGDSVEVDLRRPFQDAMTRSGMFDPVSFDDASDATGEHSTDDMVNRLDPRSLAWLESSPAEQAFLGWSIEQLRTRSFLEIIHPDDRDLAREQLRSALIKGEAHGLVYRIKTASGDARAIEMYVGVRYGPDRRITHLRCHLRDVTAKVRASRELRRRTRELTLVNQELRRANRELQELKDRYSDLYQNAPAMYFSLDARGRILDGNNTMFQTLGFRRDQLIGQPYERLLPESMRPAFPHRFAEFLEKQHLDVESRWCKSDGTEIVVWINASAVMNPDGTIRSSRSVALDVTAQRTLEAELRAANALLAATNEEISRKVKELDEFGYVVSHDLQEPLRTLIAFSDFLVKDCGDRLDETGREYVRHLVDASRRMRAMIQDLLALSRAGKVTSEFGEVNLEEVVALVRSDLAELIRSRGAVVDVVGALPAVWGDRDRLVQLVSNLVTNGLKYNRSETPRIELGPAGTPADDEDDATFFVRDNGIGIDPKFHARIFQLFRRLHTREEYEGTGAGLAICQKIVQAHGGRIWVESEPGRGSTFFIRLPRDRAAAPRNPAEGPHER